MISFYRSPHHAGFWFLWMCVLLKGNLHLNYSTGESQMCFVFHCFETRSQAWLIWYPFWSMNTMDWKGKGRDFFFQCHVCFQCLADEHFPSAPRPLSDWVNQVMYRDSNWQIRQTGAFASNKSQFNSWTIFQYQLPATCTWCKETQGKDLSVLPKLKTSPRNYSQTVLFSSAFVPQPPSFTLKQIHRDRCWCSNIKRETQYWDLNLSFSITVLPYWPFPKIRGPSIPRNALNISTPSYYPPFSTCCGLGFVLLLLFFSWK